MLQKYLFHQELYFLFLQTFEDSTKVWRNRNITPKQMPYIHSHTQTHTHTHTHTT